ncbi:MAG: pseudouridine synthase [Desulfovibrio sp.]|uniref:pseudouridine synthase n=1 Tax=Desulfovibrio sp. 7SRBS1 TaxID=3378064 RepID=UPI003B3D669B
MTTEKNTFRLNKALAQAGICSRRKADELIFAGKVRINGDIVTEPGRQIDPTNAKVEVNGSPIDFHLEEAHIYLMLHKPIRTVSTVYDPQGRPTVLDLIPEEYRQRRVVPVGRLDFFSEGLLLFTTDGELHHLLTHPKHHLPKLYEVKVRGEVTNAKLAIIRKGMTLAEGEQLAPVPVSIMRREKGNVWLSMRLFQGINRQIRRMCRDLDLTILRLQRVAMGPVKLAGLPSGECRELREDEVNALKKAVK